MLGKKATMLCTASVEEVIGDHYKNQTYKLEADENELKKDGLETTTNPDTELVEESEDVIFVKAIKALTENVKSFFSSLFGFRTEIALKN